MIQHCWGDVFRIWGAVVCWSGCQLWGWASFCCRACVIEGSRAIWIVVPPCRLPTGGEGLGVVGGVVS